MIASRKYDAFLFSSILKQEHAVLYTVATKIIRQASINFFHSLYLRHNKS